MEHYKNLSLENIAGEQWVKFHESKLNYYLVSNFGRIKSVHKNTGKTIIKKQRLKKHNLKKYDNQYHQRLYFITSKNGTTITKAVSRLVANAFIPNPNNLPVVAHIDNNPLNNQVSNLRHDTYSGNTQQAREDGLITDNILTVVLNRKAELLGQFDSISKASEFINSYRPSFNGAVLVKGHVLMKKDYYNQLNYDELLHVCRNVNSRGEIKKVG